MALNMPPSFLSFIPGTLQVTRVMPSADRVTIEASPRPTTANCPTCGVASRRIHMVYRRVLSDLPWQGRPATIRVAARRFHCCNRTCSRQTFVERQSEVMALISRQTGRLRDLHQHLALALGGQAGACLAAWLAIPVSPDTLLRLASARLLMADTSRLNAVDDFFRGRMLEDEPALGAAIEWAKQLNSVFRRQVTGNLDELLAAASTTLARFAAGLRRDFDAINAALVLPWTTSPVEGQISRLKMLKRTMYGRAGFQLLRARVMYPV